MPDPWSGGPRVTVVTPTIPARRELLLEAQASIHAQTEPCLDLCGIDTEGLGPATVRNRLLQLVPTPYVAFLDDDDLLDPEHVAILLSILETTNASVAYSYCRVTGPAAVEIPRPVDERQVWRRMHQGRNCIPVTVLARTSAIRAGGCFDPADRYEDYALWMRLKRLGHRFALYPHETWTYRMLGENRTHA